MALNNNALIVRHKLLAKLVDLWNKGNMVGHIDRLPIDLSPRKTRHLGRCCVHKERAVYKYKMFPLMGFDMSDETDELTPLNHYASLALDGRRGPKDNILCVIDDACSSCVQVNYEITNLCRGCISRSCYMNCPKNAIRFKQNGQAEIDHSACISCGKCHQSCPYHAIVYIPVPCEEACPVKAISKDADGVEHIDESKCIYCGKCINACPFGAIFELSQVFDVLQAIRRGDKVVAMPAPSILGQFGGDIDQVYGALKKVGFWDIVEVAQGAMTTVEKESAELKEKLAEGQAFMTTSCCPSYIELVNKHIPHLKPMVSGTKSPMYYTARIAKEKYPDAKVVFIGPCVAKRKEARRDEMVDYVMTFEEIASIFEGLHINLEETQRYVAPSRSVRQAHGFAQTGGVAGAVKAYLGSDEAAKIPMMQVADLNKKNIALLRGAAKTGKMAAKFVEVMACQQGCISGPSSHNDTATGQHKLNKELDKIEESY